MKLINSCLKTQCRSLKYFFILQIFPVLLPHQTDGTPHQQCCNLVVNMINERRIFRVLTNDRRVLKVLTNESRVLTSPLPVAHPLFQDSVPKVTRNLKSNSPNFFLGVFRSWISWNINWLILYCQAKVKVQVGFGLVLTLKSKLKTTHQTSDNSEIPVTNLQSVY